MLKSKELKCKLPINNNFEFTINIAFHFLSPNSKDVSLPPALQRAMAAEAEASREARAKVIAAEGEMKASRALKEASDVMSQSPAALQVCTGISFFVLPVNCYCFVLFSFQLRYLQTLNSIASEKNSTIIFPLPMELMRGFMPQRALD